MSQSFNFPANPTLNQIVTLPDGTQAQWNGYAWVSVTNNVTYPLAIPNGGTGATNPLTAKRNLAIPIWTLDDTMPAAPVYGDRWIRPGSMTEVVWLPNANNAGVWVNLADAGSEAYPIPISKGGTGATTAAQARINLGIDYTTQPFLLQDGTVAAPGLAWASEVGLGWFRSAASVISMAAGGNRVGLIDASATAQTTFGVNPRAVGATQINLSNAPLGAANYNVLGLTCNQSGHQISESLGGTNAAKPLTMTFTGIYAATAGFFVQSPAGQSLDASLILNKPTSSLQNILWGCTNASNRWAVILGNSGLGDFSILRYDDTGSYVGQTMLISRSSGLVTFAQNVVACAAGPQGANGQLGFAINGTEQSVYLYSSPAYRLAVNTSGGLTFLQTNGVTRTTWDTAGTMVNNGSLTIAGASINAFKPGGGVWADSSDVRVKHDIRDYTAGLEEVLALRPRVFKFRPETGRDQRDYIGLVYQEAGAMPELHVANAPAKLGELEYDDMGGIDATPLPYALVNAIKTLNARLAALEARP